MTAAKKKSSAQEASVAELIDRLATVLAVVSFGLVVTSIFLPLRSSGRFDALLLASLTVLTLAKLARELPLQNVLLAAIGIALIGGGAHALSAAKAIPFGPFVPTLESPAILEKLVWPMPLIWIVAILNSRGVARLVLRPWRTLDVYGYWFMGVTAALATLFSLGLEPFATRVREYWLWTSTRLPVHWHGAPLTNFPGWFAVALLILVFVTPALINKNPRKLPPDFQPLAVWVGLDVLFALGAASRGLWSAVAFCAVAGAGVAFAAIRGASSEPASGSSKVAERFRSRE